MFLTIRMMLYFIFAALSGAGIGISFDQTTGVVSVSVDALATVLAGIGGFVATFAASRLAKARGGKT